MVFCETAGMVPQFHAMCGMVYYDRRMHSAGVLTDCRQKRVGNAAVEKMPSPL